MRLNNTKIHIPQCVLLYIIDDNKTLSALFYYSILFEFTFVRLKWSYKLKGLYIGSTYRAIRLIEYFLFIKHATTKGNTKMIEIGEVRFKRYSTYQDSAVIKNARQETKI